MLKTSIGCLAYMTVLCEQNLHACRKMGLVPVSYFLRHMTDAKVFLAHHGLGKQGMKALSKALVVSQIGFFSLSVHCILNVGNLASVLFSSPFDGQTCLTCIKTCKVNLYFFEYIK